MCAKNHLLIFSSFLDIWENVEWPRFFGPPCRYSAALLTYVLNSVPQQLSVAQLTLSVVEMRRELATNSFQFDTLWLYADDSVLTAANQRLTADT